MRSRRTARILESMSALVAAAVAAALALQYLLETGLVALNIRHARTSTGVPDRVAPWFDDAAADRSRAYVRANGWLAVARNTWDLGVVLALVFSGVLPLLDRTLSAAGLHGP